VDALKNFMSTMTDAIMQQVSKQVKKAMEAASSARPLLHFEYVPAMSCQPSRRRDPVASPRCNERVQEASRVDGDRQSREENRDHSIGANAYPNCRPGYKRLTKSTPTSVSYATHSRRTAWFEEQEQTSRPRRWIPNDDRLPHRSNCERT